MKRLLLKLFVIFLLFLSSCSPPIKNVDSNGKTIVCFGDSITFGVGSDPGGNYPSYLEKMLGRAVINSGLPGDTTKNAFNRLEKDVISYYPYLVIVEIGGNDFLTKVPKKKTMENIKKIIKDIQEKGAMVVLCDISSSFLFCTYKNDYKRLAKKTGAIFVPGLLVEILENPSLRYDQIHPNSKGYKIIAQRIYNTIKPYIK